MTTASKTPALLATAAILASASLLAACDKSAQSADGAVGEGQVGVAANTPTGQVVPTTGTNNDELEAPEVTAAPAAGDAAMPAGETAAPAPK